MASRTQNDSPVKARRVRVPDFFIVGHPKSGTTALHEMLRQHPEIYMPALKEPEFFSPDLRTRDLSADEYYSLFEGAGPGQRVGETSVFYLASRVAAPRIGEARPDARIIAILREPASFIESLHLQFLRSRVNAGTLNAAHKIETEPDLRKALALEQDRRERLSSASESASPLLLYRDHVRYVDQLRRYHAVFGPEQVLVLIYDDFRRDNRAVVRRILEFLDVDPTFSLPAVEINPAFSIRSQAADDLLYAMAEGRGPVLRAMKSAVMAVTSRRMRHATLAATKRLLLRRAPQRSDAQLINELRDRFRPEVVALSEYLQRDLVALWGYDEALRKAPAPTGSQPTDRLQS